MFNLFFTSNDRAKLIAVLALVKEIRSNMATKQDLEDAIAGAVSAVQQLGTDMNKAIADLEQKLGAGVDYAPEVQKLKDLATAAQQFDAQAQAADATTQAPASDQNPPTSG